MTSYIAQRINTASGERIVHLAQLSLWSFLPRYALATLLLAASVATFVLVPAGGAYGRYAPLLSIVPAVMGAAVLIGVLVRFYTTEIGVTSHRVMVKTGLVARRTPEMALEKIEMQELRQSAAGRMCGYATLHVRGAGDENMIIADVDDPVVLTDRITDAMETRHRTLAERARAPAPLGIGARDAA